MLADEGTNSQTNDDSLFDGCFYVVNQNIEFMISFPVQKASVIHSRVAQSPKQVDKWAPICSTPKTFMSKRVSSDLKFCIATHFLIPHIFSFAFIPIQAIKEKSRAFVKRSDKLKIQSKHGAKHESIFDSSVYRLTISCKLIFADETMCFFSRLLSIVLPCKRLGRNYR